jgi:hypothetical protein
MLLYKVQDGCSKSEISSLPRENNTEKSKNVSHNLHFFKYTYAFQLLFISDMSIRHPNYIDKQLNT